MIANELASVAGAWGIDNRKGKMLNIAFFSFNLQAIWAVLRGREIKFKVTPKARNNGNFLHLVWPQIAVVGLTILTLGYAISYQALFGAPSELTNLVVNGFWATINAYAMTVLISAAIWRPDNLKNKKTDVKNRRRFWRVA